MPKSFSYPLYVAETENWERIAGPSPDCQRMLIAARSFERFEGVRCEVRWIGTLSHAEISVFSANHDLGS